MQKITPILLLAAAVASGCADPNPFFEPEPILPDQCRRGSEVSETFDQFERPDELDVLVVVDNSGDVLGEQEQLADAMPGFLSQLEERGLSVRVGVVTADAAAEPGLAPPGTLREGCEQNTGTIADSESPSAWKRMAACNVVQGTDGQPRQQALEVIARSVTEQPAELGEFFREQARLLVIVLSNEDDCSGEGALPGEDAARNECVWRRGRLTEVDALVEQIQGYAQTPEGVAMAVLSGPPSGRDVESGEAVRPVCQGTLGASYPANRLHRATELFGEQGSFESLCTDDLSFSLDDTVERLAGPMRATLCPARRLVHEPLQVTVRRGAEDADLALGEDGFFFLGSTPACETGALSLAPQALDDAEAVDVRYCVDE